MKPLQPSTEHPSSDRDTQEGYSSSHASRTSKSASTDCEARESASSDPNTATQSSEQSVDISSKDDAADGAGKSIRSSIDPSKVTIGSTSSSLKGFNSGVAASRAQAQRLAIQIPGDQSDVPAFQFSKAPPAPLNMQGTRRSQTSAAQVIYDNPVGSTHRTTLTDGAKNGIHRPPSANGRHHVQTPETAFPAAVAHQSAGPSIAPEVQRQVDEQLQSEASADSALEREPIDGDITDEPSSDDVMFVGQARVAPEKERQKQLSSRQASAIPQAAHDPGHTRSPRPQFKVSTQLAAMRITKPGNKRRTGTEIANSTTSDTEDLLRIIKYKLGMKERAKKTLIEEFDAEREVMERELQYRNNCQEELQNELAGREQQCQDLTKAVETHRTQIAKAKNLQKFLNGLGNDLSSLKQAFDVHKEKLGAVKAGDVKALEAEISNRQELESQLLKAKANLEKQLEMKDFNMQAVVSHRDSLQTQLEDRVGQLAEERDRNLDLRQRIKHLEDNDREAFSEAIRGCKQAIMLKLNEAVKKDNQFMLGLGEVQEAIQVLCGRFSASPSDCAKITAAVENLQNSLLSQAKAVQSDVELRTLLEGMQRGITQGLQADLCDWKLALDQHANNRETHAQLRSELDGAMRRSTELKEEVTATKAADTSLKQCIVALKGRIRELEEAPPAKSLPTAADVQSSTEGEQQRIRDAVGKAQKQMSESATKFNAQEQAKSDNRLKRITAERNDLAEEIQAQVEEVTNLKSKLEHFEGNQSSALADARRREQEYTNRVQSLEQDLKTARSEIAGKDELRSKYNALLAEKETDGATASSLRHTNATLTQEAEDRKAALLEASKATQAANDASKSLQNEQATLVKDLRAKLRQAEEDAKRREEGITQLRDSCQQSIDIATEKHQKQVEALQDRITQAQAELEHKNQEAEAFRRETEEAYGREHITWQTKLGVAERRAAEMTTARAEAAQALQQQQQQAGNLQCQHDELNRTAANRKDAYTQVNFLDKPLQPSMSSGPVQKPNNTLMPGDDLGTQDEATCTTSTRTRKKVNRHGKTIAETQSASAASLSQPGAEGFDPGRRPPPSRTTSGVLVEDSQFGAQSQYSASHQAVRLSTSRLVSRSSDSEEMLDFAPSHSQTMPEMVPETQLDETLKTFASFTRDLASSQRHRSKSASSQHGGAPHFIPDSPKPGYGSQSMLQPSTKTPNRLASPGFQIYEDDEGDHRTQNSMMDPANDEFSFKMPTAKPNSASKRLPRTQSYEHSVGTMNQASRLRTPSQRAHATSKTAPHRELRPLSQAGSNGSSSTPPFIEKSDAQLYGSANLSQIRRRISSSHGAPIQDPRLAAKTAGNKRTAEPESQQQYETDRKKRARNIGGTATVGKVPSNDGRMSGCSQSIHDLPRLSDRSSKRVPSGDSSSRMRTYAGSSTRATRSKTKRSKNDEYSARFAQELGGN